MPRRHDTGTALYGVWTPPYEPPSLVSADSAGERRRCLSPGLALGVTRRAWTGASSAIGPDRCMPIGTKIWKEATRYLTTFDVYDESNASNYAL